MPEQTPAVRLSRTRTQLEEVMVELDKRKKWAVVSGMLWEGLDRAANRRPNYDIGMQLAEAQLEGGVAHREAVLQRLAQHLTHAGLQEVCDGYSFAFAVWGFTALKPHTKQLFMDLVKDAQSVSVVTKDVYVKEG